MGPLRVGEALRVEGFPKCRVVHDDRSLARESPREPRQDERAGL